MVISVSEDFSPVISVAHSNPVSMRRVGVPIVVRGVGFEPTNLCRIGS